jgi:hypothetical protein
MFYIKSAKIKPLDVTALGGNSIKPIGQQLKATLHGLLNEMCIINTVTAQKSTG